MAVQARNYAEDKAQGRAMARGDVPFLFKAFEAGQVGQLRSSCTGGESHQRGSRQLLQYRILVRTCHDAQAPPPRPGTRRAEEPRAATIHEYLDWTVTSSSAMEEDQLVVRLPPDTLSTS